MSSDDPHYTFNEISNEDKELLLRNGYVPGELSAEDTRELLADLRAEEDDNNEGEGTADERDS